MKTAKLWFFAAAALIGCQSGDQVGYVRLALPSLQTLAAASGQSAVFETASVNTWTVTVSGEDMEEPVVVSTTEREVTVQVKAGPQRIVHVSARADAVEGIAQGYDGETVVDVPEEGNAEAVVDVYRSVTISDGNTPVTRAGAPAPASAPDIATLTLTLGADSMQLFLTFVNEVAAPWNVRENSIRGLIEFDLDRNPQTGNVSLVQARSQRVRAALGTAAVDAPLGTDVMVDLSPASQGFVRLVSNQTSKPIAATFGAGVLSVTVPYADLGGQPSALRLAAMILDTAGSSDFMPEQDYVEIAVAATPPPAGEAAVSSFQRFLVANINNEYKMYTEAEVYYDYFQPQIALTRGPTGFHAAWTRAGGVEYAFGENGQIFGTRRMLTAASGNFALISLAVDKTGNPKLAVDNFTDCGECSPASTVIYSGLGSDLGAAIQISENYKDSLTPSKIAVLGDSVLALVHGGYEPQSESSIPTKLYRITDRKIAASSTLPEIEGFFYYDAALKTSADGAYVAFLDGYNEDFRVYSVNNELGLSAVSLPGRTFTQVEDHFSFDVTDRFAAVFSDYWDGSIIVYDANGKEYRIPDANADWNVSPQLKISASGRIGVVWQKSGFAQEEQTSSPRQLSGFNAMAVTPPGKSNLYYAEILPGASAFSAPVDLGKPGHAVLEFDASGRPVILVVTSGMDEYGYLTARSEINVYHGR